MVFNFRNKYFTLFAIAFGIYIFYDAQKKLPPHQFDDTSLPQTAKYVLEIDPNKPESEKTFYEKWLYNYAVSKKVEKSDAPYNQFQDSKGTSNTAKIELGDQVTLKFRRIETPESTVQPLTIIAGKEMMPKFVENALIGMTENETKILKNSEIPEDTSQFEIKILLVLKKVDEK